MTVPHITDLYFEEEFAKFSLTYKRPRNRHNLSRMPSSASLTPTFQGLMYTDAAYLLETNGVGL
jgi:hypothetical protein